MKEILSNRIEFAWIPVKNLIHFEKLNLNFEINKNK